MSSSVEHETRPAAVVDLLMDRDLCLPCLARESNVPAEDVTAVLSRLQRHFQMHVTDTRCEDCGTVAVVHRLR
jgi:hypothetical protein